jgi:hypothetical protein
VKGAGLSTPHLEKGSKTGKTGAKGGKPPEAVRHAILQGGLESEETGRAAHVAVMPEDRGAGFGMFFRQAKLPPKGAQDFTTAGVPDPSGYLLGFAPVEIAGAIEHRAGMLGGKGGNFRRKKIPQKPTAVVEAKMFTVLRSRVAGRPGPANGRSRWGSLGAKQHGSGTVTKEAGADEDAGVVIQIRGGRTNFHTGHQNMAGPSRLNQSGRLIQGWESGAATAV